MTYSRDKNENSKYHKTQISDSPQIDDPSNISFFFFLGRE